MKTNARAFAAAFVEATRDDGSTFIKLSDDAPEWMQDTVHEAHFGRMPNDTDYSAICEVVEAIAEALDNDEDLDDARHERIDGMVPYYNADRLRWLAEHYDHAACCDEARDQGLVSEDADMMTRIGAGMYGWYDAKWGVVVDALNDMDDTDE